ncbi:hypothetical protein ABZP36_033959 [Zizania latifolia]
MPVTPDTAHRSPSNNKSAIVLASSCSPPVGSSLNHAGSEMFQPPERKGSLKGSAPQDTLSNGGVATNRCISMSATIPMKVTQLKLVNDVTHMKDIPKPSGNISNAVIGTDVPIPQKVPQLKFVEDISQMLVGSTANAGLGTDALIPVKMPQLQLVKDMDITVQMVTAKPASIVTSASNGATVPISWQVPWVKLVKDVTPQMFTSRPGSAAVKIDYRAAVAIPPKMPQLKLVKDITPHTATQKPATNLEKAIQQKKRKANNATGESPVARHRPNTNDMPPSLLARSSESSIPHRFSKAVLMDNLRSLAKLHLADELSGTLPTLTTNDMLLSRSELMENLRFLAKNHNFSNIVMDDGN